jgi:cullin 3
MTSLEHCSTGFSVYLQEIKLETNIAEQDLMRAIQSLSVGKKTQTILRKEPKSKHVDITDIFFVNDDFKSKIFKIKIHTGKNLPDV